MSALITRYPARDAFGPLFNRLFTDFTAHSAGQADEPAAGWRPRADIRETEEAFVINVDLPGLTKDEVSITLEDNTLTLSGERQFDGDKAKDSLRHIERSYGMFSRSFSLPTNLRTDQVDASFAKGVLSISLPKAEEAKARRIEIA